MSPSVLPSGRHNIIVIYRCYRHGVAGRRTWPLVVVVAADGHYRREISIPGPWRVPGGKKTGFIAEVWRVINCGLWLPENVTRAV